MLSQYSKAIPAEARDFPEWHHGRKTYAVWILQLEDKTIQEKFRAARQHLDGYLVEPYPRQPHITLFVCGFLVDDPKYNDDFTQVQLETQLQTLDKANLQPFEIEIRGLDSFASAPYLVIHDPNSGIPHLRSLLSRGAREFRTAPYTPHLTVGLYTDAFPSEQVMRQLTDFSWKPIKWKVNQITLATYRAQEFVGPLTYEHEVSLIKK